MISKSILLEAIYNKTGIYISTKNDCRLISQLIANEKVGFLSESTLYRLFLYNINSNKPYKNTYTVLAKFCGYPDWNLFLKYYDSNYLFNEPNFLNNSINSVLEKFILNDNFKPLIEVFNTLEHENYKTKEFFGIKTFINFQKTNSFPRFIKEFGHHSFVRNILIESLYDPFHRIDGYTESISNYILNTDSKSSTYIQDHVFGHAVLFRYYYLNSDSLAIEHGKKLYKNLKIEAAKNDIHLFPKTRFYAYKLWYLKLINEDEKIQANYFEEFLDYIHCEITKTQSVIELNIIYQTTQEVLQNLNYVSLENSIKSLIDEKIKILQLNSTEFYKLQNANGLLNILPV